MRQQDKNTAANHPAVLLDAWTAPPGRPPLVLGEPAVLASTAQARVRRHPVPLDPRAPLDTSGRTFIHAGHRRGEALEVLRFPVLACVLAGEADYRVADYILTLGEGSFFLVPPGVPGPDGTRPHWERAEPQAVPSETLWLVPLPSGAFTSSCRVEGTEHLAGRPRVFIPDSRLLTLTDMLIEALRLDPREPAELAHSLLRTLVLCLAGARAHALPALPPAADQAPADMPPVVRRVLEFIDSHLHEPLSLDRLAAAAHISVPHLQRLFTAHVGSSVMQHVTARRVTQARQLLAHTDLPAAEVGRLVGYTHPAHFSRVFRKAAGMTPGQYREEAHK